MIHFVPVGKYSYCGILNPPNATQAFECVTCTSCMNDPIWKARRQECYMKVREIDRAFYATK